jgi:hypothetical protein
MVGWAVRDGKILVVALGSTLAEITRIAPTTIPTGVWPQ